LTGIRRSGKTFIFYQLIHDLLEQGIAKQRILYINFEDERLLPISTSDLTVILNIYYEIFPFSFTEYLAHKNISAGDYSSQTRALIANAFESYLHAGGFPEIADRSEDLRLKILQEYFNLILYKDVLERYNIRNQSLIKYLLKFLLANNANLFSVPKFYDDVKSQGYKCSKDALHNYLFYLEEAQPGQAGTKKAKAHAKTQRRKVTAKFFSFAFLCATFAALRLCVNAFK
jgi:predicted AAA+ superfamily ATPase